MLINHLHFVNCSKRWTEYSYIAMSGDNKIASYNNNNKSLRNNAKFRK